MSLIAVLADSANAFVICHTRLVEIADNLSLNEGKHIFIVGLKTFSLTEKKALLERYHHIYEVLPAKKMRLTQLPEIEVTEDKHIRIINYDIAP